MLRCLFALAGIVAPICALAQSSPLIVFLDFPSPQPAPVVAKAKEEVAAVLLQTGIALDFRMLSERKAGESYEQFVVVKWNGTCDARIPAPEANHKARLAYAHVSAGRVLRKSRSITVMSASIPGAITPFCRSSNDAYAPPVV